MARVVLRTYLDAVAAQLDRTRLEVAGIDARVHEPTPYNPMLTAIAGGVVLEIDELDLERAQQLLAQTVEVVDDDSDDSVRCPQCESEYTFFGGPELKGPVVNLAVLVGWLTKRVFPKRWHCRRCGHEWDDPKEGPTHLTRLPKGMQEPTFRLQRKRTMQGFAIGIPLGFILGGVVAIWINHLLGVGGVFIGLFAGIAAGWGCVVFGNRWVSHHCSKPGCGHRLFSGAGRCDACHAPIVDIVIDSVAQHYVEAARFRIEAARQQRKRTKKAERLAAAKAAQA